MRTQTEAPAPPAYCPACTFALLEAKIMARPDSGMVREKLCEPCAEEHDAYSARCREWYDEQMKADVDAYYAARMQP